MKNKFSIILAVLVIIIFSFQARAQDKIEILDVIEIQKGNKQLESTSAQNKIEGLNFSIAVENTDFRSSRRPKVKITIENKTGGTIYFGDSANIRLSFERIGLSESNCTRTDCLAANAALKDKLIENNKSTEAEINLDDLYWMDIISSFIDTKRPKNFSKTVSSGNYFFYASVSVSPNAQTSDLSKFVGLQSEKITVSL